MPSSPLPSRRRPVALTIAGSDSGGGAGIQADLKTFAACGVHGVSAVTAVTAQNSRGVVGVHEVPPAFLAAQLDALAGDFNVAGVKTGMLSSAPLIEAAAEGIVRHDLHPLVVDPVMIAQSGDPLLQDHAVSALTSQLLPLADVLTPNLPEAERLLGRAIASREALGEAARELAGLGPKTVLLKGGHLEDDCCVDVFFDGATCLELEAPRLDTKATHGTGCTLAAAVAANLAWGKSLPEAVRAAKTFITDAIRFGLTEGQGYGCVNPVGRLWREAERYAMVEELTSAVERLTAARAGRLVAEVQMNFGYALPDAVDFDDVLAYPGRLVRLGEQVHPVAAPRFGASRHVANMILAAQRTEGAIRAAVNVRFSEAHLSALQTTGLAVAEFSRAEETAAIKAREGSSLAFGVELVCQREGGVPPVIFDRGDVGKEPMIRVFGRTPAQVVDRLLNMLKVLDGQTD